MAALVVPSVFTAVDRLTAPVKGMGRTMSEFFVRNEKNFNQLSASAFKFARTGALVSVALVAPLVMATKSAMEFEAQMGNVATLLDTTKEDMVGMGDQILALATKLPVPIEELTKSLYDIRSSGIDASRAMDTLETSAKLSMAGLATTAESTNILTSAMNAFAADGLTTAQTADYLFKTVKAGKTTLSQLAQAFGATAPIVQSAGASLAEFQAMTAALTLSGTPAAQAQNQLKAAMIALMKPTADLEKIMKKLGVKTSQELIKKSGGVVNAFKAINEVGKKTGTNMAKAWGSTEALGAVTPLLDANSKAGIAYAGALDDMLHGQNAVDSASEKQMKTAAAQQQLLKNNMEALSIAVGQELIPMFTALISKVVPYIKQAKDWVKNNKELVKTIINVTLKIAAFIAVISVIAVVIGVVAKAMAIWAAITKAFVIAQTLLNVVLMANPIGLIIIAIAALVAITIIVIKNWNEWGAAAVALFGLINPGFAFMISLVQSFRRNWDMITKAFKEEGIVAGLKAIGKTILDAILQPLSQVLGIISKLTGMDWAASAASEVDKFRKDLGVNVTTDESGNKLAGDSAGSINTQKDKQQNLAKMFSETIERQQATLQINNNTGFDANLSQSGSRSIPVKLNSTMKRN